MVEDYQNSSARNLLTNEIETLHIPKSDVLIYYLEDGSKICARPSGTEPKIKFYFSVNTKVMDVSEIPNAEELLSSNINQIIEEMQLK
jgi:phosphomannomutase